MCGGIHTSRHPTEYDEPTGREVAGQPLRHARSIGRGMPGTDNRNPWLIYNFCISLKVKHEWRIINFQQAFGELRVPGNDHFSAQLTGMVKLGIGQFHRLT